MRDYNREFTEDVRIILAADIIYCGRPRVRH